LTGSAGAPSYGLGWGLIMKITIPLPLRIAAAVVVCTLGVAVAAAWMDHHGLWDLPLTLPTPADPTRWRNTVHLSAWIVGVAFAVELLIPPKPSDFGGGAAAYIAAVAGGALALLLLYHSSISAPASWREMAADWRNLASMGVRYVFFAFAVTTIVRWMMMLHKRRAQAARSRTAAPSNSSCSCARSNSIPCSKTGRAKASPRPWDCSSIGATGSKRPCPNWFTMSRL
jgi:hypothetical protein